MKRNAFLWNRASRSNGRVRFACLVPALTGVTVLIGCAPSAADDQAEVPAAAALPEPTLVASPAAALSGEPNLTFWADAPVLSWLEPVTGGNQLRMARWTGSAWSAPTTVATGDDWFVNWADFPSVISLPDGRLAAHWLDRGGMSTYDYGVRVAVSDDGGATWSTPWTPHEDATPTEHGFVSLFPAPEGLGVVWLDGRKNAPGPDGVEPTHEMTLRFRTLGKDGPGPEEEVDGRICDCCQTDVAVTDDGPVAVYRNRTEGEIRDIYVTRRVAGRWSEGVAVHADGWEIDACPVNGPAVAARGRNVAVAWFTAAGDVPRVRLAFSTDGGATFGAPIPVDDGDPAGRVDVLLLEDGSALVAWLERAEGAGEVRLRRVVPGSEPGPARTVARSSAERTSGFPRMALDGQGGVLLAWTDVEGDRMQVRTARLAGVSR